MCRRSMCLVLLACLFGLTTAVQAERIDWVRAAYWDARYPTGWLEDSIGISIRDGLAAAGYEVLNADQLKEWMTARIADKKYSVVVMCRDITPDTVVETMDTQCTLRRYLDAGGKIVNLADIPFYNQGHVGLVKTGWTNSGAPAILGFDTSASAARDKKQTVILTDAGKKWGLVQTWASARPTVPTGIANLTILASDTAGNAASWVKHYVEGDTFRGYVRLWDVDVTATVRPTLDEIIRVAEYTGLSASKPDPADGKTGVSMQLLQWTAADAAALQYVYLGTDEAAVEAADVSSPEYKAQHSVAQSAYWSPTPLEPGVTYYWRIDTRTAGDTVYAGPVWSFTATPPAAWDPKPANGANYVATDATLNWTAGLSAAQHDVYFGTDRAAVEAGAAEVKKMDKQLDASYTPAGLERGVTYYWRVDELVGADVVPGEVWSFTVRPVVEKADASLIGWWKMDDEKADVAVDSSGWDHYGTLVAGPQWSDGYFGEALKFDGVDDYVDCGTDESIAFSGSVTIMAWVKSQAAVNDGKIASNQNNATGGYKLGIYQNKAEFEIRTAANTAVLNRAATGGVSLGEGTWYHVTGVYSMGQHIRTYVNGTLDREFPTTEVPGVSTGAFMLGRESYSSAYFWSGWMDDVRLYNRALTEQEIAQIMQGDPLLASAPQPAKDARVDVRDATQLDWSAGTTAAQHDVYFGTNRRAVEEAGTSSPEYMGRQTEAGFDLTDKVVFGDCFWRIDEVEADGTTIHQGDVWQFTVADYLFIDEFETYTNDSPTRLFQTWLDSYGYSADDFFDTAYPGNGTGAAVGHDIWAAGTTYTSIAERTFVHGGSQAMPLYYNNASADKKYYSETERVWTSPQDLTAGGATDLSLWFKGRPVRFVESADGKIVMSSMSGDISGTNADYFRYAYRQLTGDGSMTVKVSSLTMTANWPKAGVMIRETLDQTSTRAHMIVTANGRRAFENRAATGGASASMYSAIGAVKFPIWVKVERKGTQFTGYYSEDGVTWTPNTNTGTGAGGASPNPQTIAMGDSVYIGLCVTSNNLGSPAIAELSDVTTTGNVTGSWTIVDIGGVNPANDMDDLYVAIQDKSGKIGIATWPDATIVSDWKNWTIPLSQFAGVDVSAVKKMFIGVGSRTDPQPDGAGLIYLDDIRITMPAE